MSAIKSVFIPHVFPNFTQEYVANAFSAIANVNRVDFVAKQDRDGKLFNSAYIHFNNWDTCEFASWIKSGIEKNGSAKFYHDDSEYYWIVLPNTAKKHVPGERKQIIDLGEAKSVSVKAVHTPEKQPKEVSCPGAPKKASYAQVICDKQANSVKHKEFVFEDSEESAQMSEIEALMDAEDANLVTIDGRYVQIIEQENAYLHSEVAQLRAALINMDQMYQAEAAKVRAMVANTQSAKKGVLQGEDWLPGETFGQFVNRMEGRKVVPEK